MNKSFTLIEILVVIVIIGILSAFILIGMSSITSSANIAKSQAFLNSMNNTLLLGRVSQWKLDQIGAGPYTTPDAWGTNTCTLMDVDNACSFTGTLKCPQPVTSGCPSGNCLSFDGVNDYINCGNQSGYNLNSTDHTITAWFKTSGTTTSYVISRFAGGSPGSGYVIYLSTTGKVTFEERADGGNSISYTTTPSFNDNVWHLVSFVVTLSPKMAEFYVDGRYLNEDDYAGNLINYNTTLYIGNSISSYYLNGSIDDVRIYNQAISTSEIQHDYFLGINRLFKDKKMAPNKFTQSLVELKSNLVEAK